MHQKHSKTVQNAADYKSDSKQPLIGEISTSQFNTFGHKSADIQ